MKNTNEICSKCKVVWPLIFLSNNEADVEVSKDVDGIGDESGEG